jgi:hypothetical protein
MVVLVVPASRMHGHSEGRPAAAVAHCGQPPSRLLASRSPQPRCCRGRGLLRLAGIPRRPPARSTDGRWPCRRPSAATSSSPARATCPRSRRGPPMPSFCLGSLFGRGRTRAPIEVYREGRPAARNRRTPAPASADRPDRPSRPGRVRFAVAATPHRRHPVTAPRHATGGPQGHASLGRSPCTASLSSPTPTLPRRA